MLDIFFIILSLHEGYYWVSLQISFRKAFESATSTLKMLKCLAWGDQTMIHLDSSLRGLVGWVLELAMVERLEVWSA
jgi:hypothetical protein